MCTGEWNVLQFGTDMRKIIAVVFLLLAHQSPAFSQEVGVACNGGYASGTAVPGAGPGKTYILTNRHVADAAGSKDIKYGDKLYASTLIAKGSNTDLAVYEITASLPTYPIAESVKAKPIQVKGYGVNSGGFDKIRSGTFSGSRGGSDRLSLFISPGDSGSGVIQDGELVAVVWGCLGASGGPGLAVPLKDVQQFMAGIPKPKRLTYRL